MAMDAEQIEQLILSGIPDAVVTISDLRGDGDHYAAHGFNFSRHFLAGLQFAAGNDDIRASLSHGQSHLFAQATAAARNQGHLAGKI